MVMFIHEDQCQWFTWMSNFFDIDFVIKVNDHNSQP